MPELQKSKPVSIIRIELVIMAEHSTHQLLSFFSPCCLGLKNADPIMFMGKAMQLNDTLGTRNSEQAYHCKTTETDPNTHTKSTVMFWNSKRLLFSVSFGQCPPVSNERR